MARSRRGGARTPSSPAPVSGPGALARRTDGGPGQPTRVASGGPYGSRQAMENLQQAAPLAAGSPPGGIPQAAGGGPVPRDAFGPTELPDEPDTSGIPYGAGPNGGVMLPSDPDMFLRVLYEQTGDPDLLRLIQRQR